MIDIDRVPASFIVGDLTFRAYDNRIYKDGKEIDIHGQKEYQILCCLANRARVCAGSLVTHEELSRFMYDGAAPASNVFNVFVFNIRKKLRDVNSCVSIETVNNKGHCLVVASETSVSCELAAE